MLMSTVAFYTECSKKQIPKLPAQKQLRDQCRRQQYQAQGTSERYFVALLFQKLQ